MGQDSSSRSSPRISGGGGLFSTTRWSLVLAAGDRRNPDSQQALPLMSHPNIARVHEAGTTDQGRAYFVMEYVDGEPITDYCDRHRLTTRERLELFSRVCEGVQHAHQKGIIHRDIKPSNVLVASDGGEAVPKIIDFGVAKATEQPLSAESMFTGMGVLLGTPEYMSPEQAQITTLDVDTRTDVYSLGVLLYEQRLRKTLGRIRGEGRGRELTDPK